MANLLGQDIGTNYKGIITIGSTINQNVSASLQSLTDGDGNALPIQVSTTNTQLGYGVGIGGAPSTDGLKVYGQSGKTGMSLIGIGATMYVDLNGTGTNFFDSVETRYRNAAGTNIAMNVWGNLGRVAIGGLATNYTPTAALQVRGDGTNPIFRAENTDGTYRYLMNLTQQIVNVGNGGFFNVRPNEGTTNNPGIDFAVGTSGNLTFIRFAGERYTIGHTGANNANAGILFQINNAIATANFSRFTFGVSSTSITVTSGTSAGLIYTDTFAAAAGSANYRPLSINYTINNSGAQTGTVTGIYLNSTQTNLNGATHNLMDLQVGTISKFKIGNTGKATLYDTLLAYSSTSAGASINIPSGVAPTTPSNGDIWFDGTNIFMRIGGVTKTFTLV